MLTARLDSGILTKLSQGIVSSEYDRGAEDTGRGVEEVIHDGL